MTKIWRNISLCILLTVLFIGALMIKQPNEQSFVKQYAYSASLGMEFISYTLTQKDGYVTGFMTDYVKKDNEIKKATLKVIGTIDDKGNIRFIMDNTPVILTATFDGDFIDLYLQNLNREDVRLKGANARELKKRIDTFVGTLKISEVTSDAV